LEVVCRPEWRKPGEVGAVFADSVAGAMALPVLVNKESII